MGNFSEQVWGDSRERQHLDEPASGTGTISERIKQVIATFVEQRKAATKFDWRYYLARYDCMRTGRSGIYYGADRTLGYVMTMLDQSVQRSYYRDPYLYAMWLEAGTPGDVKDPWFYGYSTTARWMQLMRRSIGLRSIHNGIANKDGIDESAA